MALILISAEHHHQHWQLENTCLTLSGLILAEPSSGFIAWLKIIFALFWQISSINISRMTLEGEDTGPTLSSLAWYSTIYWTIVHLWKWKRESVVMWKCGLAGHSTIYCTCEGESVNVKFQLGWTLDHLLNNCESMNVWMCCLAGHRTIYYTCESVKVHLGWTLAIYWKIVHLWRWKWHSTIY